MDRSSFIAFPTQLHFKNARVCPHEFAIRSYLDQMDRTRRRITNQCIPTPAGAILNRLSSGAADPELYPFRARALAYIYLFWHGTFNQLVLAGQRNSARTVRHCSACASYAPGQAGAAISSTPAAPKQLFERTGSSQAGAGSHFERQSGSGVVNSDVFEPAGAEPQTAPKA